MAKATESTAQFAQLDASENKPGNPPPGFPPITKRRAPRNRKSKAAPDQQSQTVKRRGRPKGSSNRKFAEVAELPAVCPACGSEKLKAVPGKPVAEMESPGNILGVQFDRVRWRDTKCQCGQLVRVRQYLRKN